jgi:mannose/fructose/N-acetylgalactosamine-specific phosphotransferase system component IID
MMEQRPSEPPRMHEVNRRVFGRSFFLETLWNDEKMQSAGFLFCLYPALRRVYSNESDLKAALARHAVLVNTHPVLAPLLVGITARLERDGDRATVVKVRHAVMTTLAAFGDRVFWSHLRPLASVIGVVTALVMFWSPLSSLLFLVTFNVPNLIMRSGGFQRGWTEGLVALGSLGSPMVPWSCELMRAAIYLGLGLAAGLLACAAGSLPVLTGSGTGQWILVSCLVATCGAGVLALRWNTLPSLMLYLTAIAGVLLLILCNTALGVP